MIEAFLRYRRLVRRERRALVLGGLCALAAVAGSLAQPWPLAHVVDHVLRTQGGPPAHADRAIAAAVAALLLIVGFNAAADYGASRLLSGAGLRIANALREEVFAHLNRLSLRYHGQRRVGDLVTRVTGDVDRTQDMMVQALAILLPNTFLVVGMFTVMLLVSPLLTAVALVVTPVMAAVVHRSKRALTAASRRARRADGMVAAAATEGLGAIHLVQAFTLEPHQQGRFGALSAASLQAGLVQVRLQARFSPVVDLTGALSTGAVLWFGAHRVLAGQLRLGVLLVFLAYLSSLYKPIKQLSKLATVTSKGAAAAERVAEVLAEEPQVRDAPRAVPAPRLTGRVELHDVSFSYGREPVLRHVELTVESGETVAFVGPTGAGKSTLVSLIPRLADPDTGVVRLDRCDVRDLQLATLRSQVSMVLQDCVLLQGTILDNIACGRRHAPRWGVEQAARLALVDEFAGRLPDGLDTVVGERGVNLSGGQRQRIAIARAILRDAPILILDEPTSALDAASEDLIVQALANLPSGRTTFVIAHRLSTVRRADRAVVLDGGRIVEQGRHEELLAAGGLYSRLASLQTGRVLPTPPNPAREPTNPGRPPGRGSGVLVELEGIEPSSAEWLPPVLRPFP